MLPTRILICFALLGISAAVLPGAAQASITIISQSTGASADDNSSGIVAQTFTGTAIPTSTTLNVIDGSAYSKNSIEWSASGGQTVLSFDIEHQRTGVRFSGAQTNINNLHFIANSNAFYELSGYYHVIDVGTSQSGIVHLSVQLLDLTSGELFANEQVSRFIHDEQLTLGGTEGDSGNYLRGDQTGNLIAGHNYWLSIFCQIAAIPDADFGASALGNVSLTIAEANAVPEPSSLLVWGAFILGAAACRDRTILNSH